METTNILDDLKSQVEGLSCIALVEEKYAYENGKQYYLGKVHAFELVLEILSKITEENTK